jgi:hypothetical protein
MNLRAPKENGRERERERDRAIEGGGREREHPDTESAQ